MNQSSITVYGTDWCGDTRQTRKYLDECKAEYRYVDIDNDAEGERKVLEAGNGKRRVPLVEFMTGSERTQLSVPSNSELGSALEGVGQTE